jgi:hypothetical protein
VGTHEAQEADRGEEGRRVKMCRQCHKLDVQVSWAVRDLLRITRRLENQGVTPARLRALKDARGHRDKMQGLLREHQVMECAA